MIDFIVSELREWWCAMMHTQFHDEFWDETFGEYNYVYCHKCGEWRQV